MDKRSSADPQSGRNPLLQAVYTNLNNINNRIRSDFDTVMSHLSLSTSQIHLLMRLDDLPEPVNAKRLSETMHLTPGAISQIIDHLHQQGYVERTDSPNDRRIAYLTLTSKGQELVDTCNRAHDKLIKQAMATLSQRELEQLANIQIKILRHMESHQDGAQTTGGRAAPAPR